MTEYPVPVTVDLDEGRFLRLCCMACHETAAILLMGRMRLPAANGEYVMYVTGNPEGHNWIYDFFFNKEISMSTPPRMYFIALTCAECGEELISLDQFMGVTRTWRDQ